MINIICIGKIKEQYLNDMINDYAKRINKYHKLNIIEIKDDNLENETKNILKNIKSNDYVISLTIEGTKMDSIEFANKLDDIFNHYSTIDFIIGESNGLDDIIKNKSHLCLSFSDLTFPHGLFRAILLEQIYRAFKINNHETYHK